MKKKTNYCLKCGKELSSSEIKLGNTKCENCIGKKAKKTKRVLQGLGALALVGIGIASAFNKNK